MLLVLFLSNGAEDNSGTKRTSFLALIFCRVLFVKYYPWQKYVSVHIAETDFILFSETVPLQLCRSYTAEELVTPWLTLSGLTCLGFLFSFKTWEEKEDLSSC